MSGLRFCAAPFESHGGLAPALPDWMLAIAIGQGHCAVKETYCPSGVAEWHPMQKTCWNCGVRLPPSTGSARTVWATCEDVSAAVVPSSPTWKPCSVVLVASLSKSAVVQ